MTVDAEQALRAMAAEDPDRGVRARSAFEVLTAGGGVAAVTQHSLQEELWYRMPRTGTTDAHDQLAHVHALGELFTRLGQPRYAAICTSADTIEIISAFARDDRDGWRRFRRAMERSGVEPPDLDDFAWGQDMGLHEAQARQSCSVALEEAVTAGRLRPGRRGWRSEQRRIVAEHLQASRADLLDESLLMAVVTERATAWVGDAGEERAELLAPIVNRLLAPVPPPADPPAGLAPLQWLLDHAADGIALTPSHALGRAFVGETTDRFGWRPLDSAAITQRDAPEVHTTQLLAKATGAVRRRGRTLQLTPSGRALQDDPARLWPAAMRSLCRGGDFSAAVGELALAVLLHAQRATHEEVAEAVAVAVSCRWRDTQGLPPGMATVRGYLGDTLRPATLLGVITQEGRGQDEPVLVVADEAGVREALRARALGPRHAL